MTTDTTAAAAVHPPLRRNRDFNLLWSGGTLSDLGSYTSLLAVPLLVLAMTGSAAQAGIVGTISAIVRGVVRLPAGAVADRWNRRRVLLTSDLARLVLYAVLGVAILLGMASLWLVVVVVALSAIFDVLFTPAEMAAVARLVPAAQLPDAFARNEARSYGATLAGPPIGGLLYGIGRAVPFLFDAATYLVSFVAVLSIRNPVQGQREESPQQSIAADVREGLSHVFRDAFLRSVLLVAAPLNFAVTGALFTMTITLREHGVSASLIGIAQGVIGVGGFLGALAAPRVQRRLSLRWLVTITCWALLASLALAALLVGHLAMAVVITAGLILAPAGNAVLFGRIGATTPDHLQGRVVSVVFLAATTAASLAPLGCGLLIDHLSGTAAMVLCAAAVLISCLTVTLTSGLRIEDQPAAADESTEPAEAV